MHFDNYKAAIISEKPNTLCSADIVIHSDIFPPSDLSCLKDSYYDIVIADASVEWINASAIRMYSGGAVIMFAASCYTAADKERLSCGMDVHFGVEPISETEVRAVCAQVTGLKDCSSYRSLYEELIEGTDNLVTRVDSEGRFTYVNEACEKAYGIKRQDLIGRYAFDFIHPADRDRTMEAFKGWVSGGQSKVSFLNRQVTASGDVLHVLWGMTLHYGSRGEVLYISSIAKDITERLMAENALKKSESSLRAILDASEDIIIVLDRSGLIIDCNRHFCNEVGLPVEKLLGNNVLAVIRSENNILRRSHFEDVLMSGEQARFEDFGSQGWFDVNITPISVAGADIERVVVFARNITDRKEAEYLEKMNEKRHKALAVLGQMYEADLEEVLEYALESALEQTASLGGYLAQYDEDDGSLKLTAYMLPEESSVTVCTGKELNIDNLPGMKSVVESKNPAINNSGITLVPDADGGFTPLNERSMILPLMAQGEVRLLMGVYGKKQNYTAGESTGLGHFMEGVWRLLERIEAERTIGLLNEELERKVTLRTAQLRESEVRFRTAFESTVHGMIIVSPVREILQVNKSFAAMLGYEEEELIGIDIQQVTHPQDMEKTGEAIRKLISGEEGNCEIIKRYVRKDGQIVFVSVNSALVKDPAGKPVYIVSNVVNITEAELTRKERDRIFELSNDIIGITDHRGFIHYVNTAFEKLLGYKVSEITGRLIWEVFRQEDAEQAASLFSRLKEERDVADFESRHLSPSGSDIWISWVFMTDNSNNRIYGIGRDVTERKLYEDSLKSAKDEAEKADRAKSEFLANISHEIRTPLNAVLGFSELLSSRVHDPKALSYLSSIKASGKALLTLINDILDISKLDSMALSPVMAPADIGLLIEDMVKVFRYRAESKGLGLLYKVDDNVPGSLMLDVSRLRQVMLNILGNAVKFTDEGKIDVRVSAVLKDNSLADIDIVVTDTGIGIPESEFEAIFQPFRQRAGQNINRYGGTGLGLSISGKLVQMMGGTINVESRIGHGSSFRVHLPDITVSDQIITDSSYYGIRVRFSPARVLVADDETSRGIIREMLENTGIFVMEAQNGFAAGLIAAEIEPDIAIISDRLPDMSGKEAAKSIRGRLKSGNIKIISLMSTAPDEDDNKLFDDILIKPISAGKLISSLEKFLRVEERVIDDAVPAAPAANGNGGGGEIWLDSELVSLIDSYKGAIDFEYIGSVVSLLKEKGSSSGSKEMLELAERLEYLTDNLEIENIRRLFGKLRKRAAGQDTENHEKQ